MKIYAKEMARNCFLKFFPELSWFYINTNNWRLFPIGRRIRKCVDIPNLLIFDIGTQHRVTESASEKERRQQIFKKGVSYPFGINHKKFWIFGKKSKMLW